MHYFDTDVIINAVIEQDLSKHLEAKRLLLNALNNSMFAISTLVIQEVGYTLARLDLSSEEIEQNLAFFNSQNVYLVEHPILKRAIELSSLIGFKHINDCVHTAIAEHLNCTTLYTYNRSDFKRTQKYTKLEISIL